MLASARPATTSSLGICGLSPLSERTFAFGKNDRTSVSGAPGKTAKVTLSALKSLSALKRASSLRITILLLVKLAGWMNQTTCARAVVIAAAVQTISPFFASRLGTSVDQDTSLSE